MTTPVRPTPKLAGLSWTFGFGIGKIIRYAVPAFRRVLAHTAFVTVRVQSRLMIITCRWNYDAAGINHPDVYYLLWEGTCSRQLLRIQTQRAVQNTMDTSGWRDASCLSSHHICGLCRLRT